MAGVDLATGQHVRPMPAPADAKALLARFHGGPVRHGRVDPDLGWTKVHGHAAGERRLPVPSQRSVMLGDMPAGEFWDRLRRWPDQARRDFRPGLDAPRPIPMPWTWAKGSLRWAAISRPAARTCSSNAGNPSSGRSIRIQFQSGQYEFELSVTDIRLYRDGSRHPGSGRGRRRPSGCRPRNPVIFGRRLDGPFLQLHPTSRPGTGCR